MRKLTILQVNRNESKIHRFFRDKYKYLQDDSPFQDIKDDKLLSTFQGMEFYPYVLIPINTSYPLLKL